MPLKTRPFIDPTLDYSTANSGQYPCRRAFGQGSQRRSFRMPAARQAHADHATVAHSISVASQCSTQQGKGAFNDVSRPGVRDAGGRLRAIDVIDPAPSRPDVGARVRLVIIGPVAPFRGGIAHHTTRLANALAGIADTRVISYSRLYPRWLYPGKTQVEESRLTLTPPADFLLDSIGPLTWRGAVARIEARDPACVIIPWWTFFLAPCTRYLARRLGARDIPVLFLCHNVVDHETAGWKRRVARMVLRHGAGFAVQTREEEGKLRRMLGDVDVSYHPHPVYDHFPPAKGLLLRRASLELLYYGFIRPYKGLDVLLDALSGLDDLSVHLSIVGEPWGDDEGVWRRRIDDAGIGDRVEFVPRYVTDEETAEYFARADAIVLPYRSATGTGVIAAAYHYRKPVIASYVGGLRDVVTDGKTGLLVPPGDPIALQAAIRRFAGAGIPGVAANIDRAAADMTWGHLAEQLLVVARRLAGSRARER
jgi:glycosyltransferase involved in cell wall biosynthesis